MGKATKHEKAVAMSELKKSDLSAEMWREYDFAGRVYRIDGPVSLWCREGGSTHRVLDGSGIVHCVPAHGNGDCVVRWCPKSSADPVQF